jgi:hypothetical protein
MIINMTEKHPDIQREMDIYQEGWEQLNTWKEKGKVFSKGGDEDQEEENQSIFIPRKLSEKKSYKCKWHMLFRYDHGSTTKFI